MVRAHLYAQTAALQAAVADCVRAEGRRAMASARALAAKSRALKEAVRDALAKALMV